MDTELFKGVGRKHRRLMKKQWKGSGSKLSLKQWATNAEVGEIAHVWLRTKMGGKHANES